MAVATGRASILFACAIAISCSSPPEAPAAAPLTSIAVVAPAAPPDAGRVAVSEVEAHSLLNRMFREAGLRIVNDHPFHEKDIEVTLDGYDPERGIGFEYVAPAEQGTDLSSAELAALQAYPGIFSATGGSLDQLERAAAAFLSQSEIPDTSAGTK